MKSKNKSRKGASTSGWGPCLKKRLCLRSFLTFNFIFSSPLSGLSEISQYPEPHSLLNPRYLKSPTISKPGYLKSPLSPSPAISNSPLSRSSAISNPPLSRTETRLPWLSLILFYVPYCLSRSIFGFPFVVRDSRDKACISQYLFVFFSLCRKQKSQSRYVTQNNWSHPG